MAAPHFHPGLNHGGPRHVCMMESYDPEVPQSTMRFETLAEENKNYAAEVNRLKALLAENNIPIPAPLPTKSSTRGPRRSLRLCNKNGVLALEEHDKPLPELPNEILLRILGYAVTSPTPLVDPFYKLRRDNTTKVERSSRRRINVNFLAANKAFNVDGNKLIVEKNELIFTQAAALERFARVPGAQRANIQNITIRCVGRYYSDRQKKLDLDGDTMYHESIGRFMVPTLARPPGLIQDGGIQAYCWYQVADLLKALQLPLDPSTQLRPKLFTGLKTLRMDLVNFCDHLPLGIWGFASVVRWHLGAICDELLITGIPELEGGSDEEMLLRNLLRDEGLISTGCPVFISSSSGLKPLQGHGYAQQVVRANKPNPYNLRASKVIHPEGGKTPTSSHTPGSTIWKWTSDHTNRPKTWIEFDRATGFPMYELDPDIDSSDDDEDEDENDWEDGDEDQDYDSDDDMFAHMPALATLLGLPLSFPVAAPESDDEMPGLVPLDGSNADEDILDVEPLGQGRSAADSLD